MNRLLAILLLVLAVTLPSAEAGKKVIPRGLMLRPPLKNAIVLVHGATVKGSKLKVGWMDFGDYFENIAEFYRPTQTPVFVAELSTDGSIGERAAVLKNFLETECKGRMVNIVAHSLGGLDARYAVSVLGSTQVASITTIGTPHHGTPLANWAERQTRHGYPWYWFFRLLGYDMAHRRFLKELTIPYMEKVFNPRVIDSPDVRYYSVQTAASYDDNTMSYLLWFPASWLEGENSPLTEHGHDGMVPFDSQKWGKVLGEFRADHLTQINHHEFRPTNESEIALNIYSVIYDNLVKEGL